MRVLFYFHVWITRIGNCPIRLHSISDRSTQLKDFRLSAASGGEVSRRDDYGVTDLASDGQFDGRHSALVNFVRATDDQHRGLH